MKRTCHSLLFFALNLGCKGDEGPTSCVVSSSDGCTVCYDITDETPCSSSDTVFDGTCTDNSYTQSLHIEGSNFYTDPDTFVGWLECIPS